MKICRSCRFGRFMGLICKKNWEDPMPVPSECPRLRKMSCEFCGAPGRKIEELVLCPWCAQLVATILKAGLGGATLREIVHAVSRASLRFKILAPFLLIRIYMYRRRR